jgi:hypothetical protein
MEEASALLVNSEEDEPSYNTPASQMADSINPLSNDELGKDFSKNDMSVNPSDDELSLENYDHDVLEVSSSEFEAAHGQKYQEPSNFLQALWNEAGPSAGSMKIMLELMKNEFKGELAGIHADMANTPQQFIDYLIKEAGKDTNNAINFIDKITDQLEEYGNKESAGDHLGDPEALPPNKREEQSEASKTQGLLPRAPKANPTEETSANTALLVEGDNEGTQSLSMASGD